MAEEGLLERLLITEEGDAAQGVARRGAASAETAPKEEAEHAGGDESKERKKMCAQAQRGAGEPRADAEHGRTGEAVVKTEEDDGPQRGGLCESTRGTAHRLTPDFPEALYELLCTFQEGRRLNDQRCSFQLEGGMRRRRCHSEPNTSKPANRVVFSSMTSLQKEEFFDLVATSQARRLDDQRSQLEKSQPAKPKSRGFRGSIKQLSFVRRPAPAPVPVPVPKEDLYNMILTTQAQGRLEDQRSRAPGPMDDDDFFSLLLRVQGGRMDEQRTELPCMLQT
uniref:G-protein signaling modulator 3 n=1 Tax=Gasterosteus aculeatus aculeatus TaxID=481459 RepID=G3PI73_GASAC